ncbi:YggS family pyridoxal phosphate-dependent enzyme [Aquidulcibacter sp.]|uniref:YggS family pyridoxal phosphate-dependent enzyme n=1 Tax=Aquidulcibacter sp. TaxID=2052990 RepID=UPI0025BBC649|nr:YggS family pyridoxal phosphate-dependent enzyme [Aquidulcibacter sp.]MCA3692487.1 YggS family pyridoxal phosphate-dependent enzyme [Aquidulcibacter sp.]
MDINQRIAEITGRIKQAAQASQRPNDSVTLVAVSKVQPEDRIEAALAAGLRVFGENRVQEAQGRWADRRKAHPDLTLHLIGPLQSNKAEDAIALFDVIETVDRPKLVQTLAKLAQTGHKLPRLLVQVNTGEEEQKAGVAPRDLPALLALCAEHNLSIEGLMCIPPEDEEPAMHFALLAKLAQRHGLSVLSMGMSGDFETAIRLGATHVRVGSALFGERVRPA